MRRGIPLLAALGAAFALGAGPPGEPAPADDGGVYDALFDARIVPTERAAHVTLRLDDPRGLVHALVFRIDPERHREFSGDGSLETRGDVVTWRPARGTSRLRYTFRIDHLRDARSYDARCAESWALFRGDDLVPHVRVTTEDGARSRSRLRLRVPRKWSVATSYPRAADGSFTVDDPRRRFDRPNGWILVGRLGVLRERIAGVPVAIAAPLGQSVHRQDRLALLRWTLPVLRDLVDAPPARLLIVGAGDPMWRGGLSAPRSAYVHAARPLITDDGTSPLLHEVVHVTLGIWPGPGGDWIVEGMAELYSVELLVRSHTMSRRRFDRSLAKLAARGSGVGSIEVDHAEGAVVDQAVTVLKDLDREIRAVSDGTHSLDDVLRVLARRRGEVTTKVLREIANQVAGRDLSAFFTRHGLGAHAARRGAGGAAAVKTEVR